MAINVSVSNTTRYYSIPNHSDLELPNNDWTWFAVCYPQNSGAIKYIVSSGAWAEAGSFNLLAYNSAPGFASRLDLLSQADWAGGSVVLDKWYLLYSSRRGNSHYVGAVQLDDLSNASEGTGVAVSSAYSNANELNIGRREDGATSRYWKGGYCDAVKIDGYGMTLDDAKRIAMGSPLYSQLWAPRIKIHARLQTKDAPIITDLTGRHLLTQHGSSYSTDIPPWHQIKYRDNARLITDIFAAFDEGGGGGGRILGSLAGQGGLAGYGGIAGIRGGLAG